jgi:hypothetical protein
MHKHAAAQLLQAPDATSVQPAFEVRGAAARANQYWQQQEAGGFGQEAGPPGFLGPEPTLVRQPGGDVVTGLVHPAFPPIERLFRKLPEESFFSPSVSSQSPIQFELGAYEIPENMTLWMFDYEFSVYRQSGIDPGDVVKAAPGRFSGFMGFDLTFSGKRKGDLFYELDPSPISLQRDAFGSVGGGATIAGDFNSAAARSFASTASPGTSLLPVRTEVQGARNTPFTLIVTEANVVSLSCVIFRQVTSPIAFIQANFGGFLVQEQVSSALINRTRPK